MNKKRYTGTLAELVCKKENGEDWQSALKGLGSLRKKEFQQEIEAQSQTHSLLVDMARQLHSCIEPKESKWEQAFSKKLLRQLQSLEQSHAPASLELWPKKLAEGCRQWLYNLEFLLAPYKRLAFALLLCAGISAFFTLPLLWYSDEGSFPPENVQTQAQPLPKSKDEKAKQAAVPQPKLRQTGKSPKQKASPALITSRKATAKALDKEEEELLLAVELAIDDEEALEAMRKLEAYYRKSQKNKQAGKIREDIKKLQSKSKSPPAP